MAVSPEQLLISSVLRESAMPLAVEKGLDQRHFHSRLAEWIFLEDYYDRYRKTPSRLVFRQSFPDFQIKPRMRAHHGPLAMAPHFALWM